MNKQFVVGVRIFIVLALVVSVLSGAYLFASKKINSYYEPAENDVFFSSMNVSNMFVADDGNVIVAGTFLQGDNILEDTSVFVKSYKTDGTLNEIAAVELSENFSVKKIFESGNNAVILATEEGEDVIRAEAFVVNSNAELKQSSSFKVPEGGNDRIFVCVDGKTLYWCYFKESGALVLTNADGRQMLEAEITSDVATKNVKVVNGTVYVLGSKNTGEYDVGYVQAIALNGKTLYAQSLMEDNVSTCYDVLPDKDGNVTVLGRFFDEEEYLRLVYPDASEESSKVLVKDVAERSINANYGDADVLVSSSFESNPWCSYFVAKADSNGEFVRIAAPFAVSKQSGITEFVIKNAGEFNGYGVSRIAADVTANSYDAAVFCLDKDFNAGRSTRMVIPSDVKTFFAMSNSGKLIGYTGLHSENGADLLCMREYESTSEFAQSRRELIIYEKLQTTIDKLTEPQHFVVIFAVILAFVTVKIKHAGLDLAD